MDFSPTFVRSSDLHIGVSGSTVNFQADQTIEFWWKPATLAAGQDQTFVQSNHTSGGSPVRLWKTDNAGSHRLRLRMQEQGGATPAADEHVEVEWDINALVSVSTWVHIAVVFDVSQAVATIAELYTDSVSRGNGTVVSGTDCSTVIQADSGVLIGSDGAGLAVDGQMFDFRWWSDVRTGTEISDNYQLVHKSSSTANNMRVNLWKSGKHHADAAGPQWFSIWSEGNGPIAFAADIPAGIEVDVGSVAGAAELGVVDEPPPSGLAMTGVAGDLQLAVGTGGEFSSYSGLHWPAVPADLVDLSGTSGAPAFVYRMRGFDGGLNRTVYWTTEAVDPLGDEYTGPGPVTDIVVSNVICS